MNILQLYDDYSIEYASEGHRHHRHGWLNVECPFCSSTGGHVGYHLGYNLEGEIFVCWRCGVHQTIPTISRLIGEPNFGKVKDVVKRYGLFLRSNTTKETTVNKLHTFPTNVIPLQENHKKYLRKRGFDPDKLKKEWNLLGTGPSSLLDGINYKHRIMIPFIWEGEQVSFDSRDITGKHTSKYMACPKARETIPHKEILYGKQEAWDSGVGICVEGPADVWRFGVHSFATSGIKYTPKQVRVMAKLFKKIWICYDFGEPQAREQMLHLRGDLRFRGVDAQLAEWPKKTKATDPGSMSQKEADYFVNNLLNS